MPTTTPISTPIDSDRPVANGNVSRSMFWTGRATDHGVVPRFNGSERGDADIGASWSADRYQSEVLTAAERTPHS